MNPVASSLLSTTLGAVFLGASLALGLVSSGLSIIFYFRLKHRSLLHFALTILISYFVLGTLNRDPMQIFDVGADPLNLRFIQVITAAGGYFFYRLVLSAFPPHASPSQLPVSFFKGFFFLAVFARVIILFSMNETTIRFASLTTGCFELITIAYVLSHPISTRSMQLNKAGCCLFSLGLMVYPLTRAGILPAMPSQKFGPLIMLGTLSVVSTVWLFALVEYARERLEEAEMASLKNMARAFIQLRDLMNTPLQTIEFSMSLLPDDFRKDNLPLERIDHALSQLRSVNVALAKFEKDVDWEQEDNFFDISEISENSPEKRADSFFNSQAPSSHLDLRESK